MSAQRDGSSSPSQQAAPPNWSDVELRRRVTVLEQAVLERNATIEKLQRELRVANSKARIVDEVQAECKVLRARLVGWTQPAAAAASASASSAGANSPASLLAPAESDIERLRRQLNASAAPSPLADVGAASLLPPTEDDEVDAVMQQAADAAEVESKEERLLRERLEKLTKRS